MTDASASVEEKTDIVVTVPHQDYEGRRQKALDSCNAQLAFFQRSSNTSRWSQRIAEIITIVLAAIIPVLLLASPPDWLIDIVSVKVLAAILSAVIAIVVGLTGAYSWREHWIRSSFFREQLRSELHRFETRTGDYAGDEEVALNRFVTRIEKIRLNEVSEWRRFVRASTKEEQTKPDDVTEAE